MPPPHTLHAGAVQLVDGTDSLQRIYKKVLVLTILLSVHVDRKCS